MRSKSWIALSNVKMFREKLAAEVDEQKRRILAALLAQEEEKLALLAASPEDPKE